MKLDVKFQLGTVCSLFEEMHSLLGVHVPADFLSHTNSLSWSSGQNVFLIQTPFHPESDTIERLGVVRHLNVSGENNILHRNFYSSWELWPNIKCGYMGIKCPHMMLKYGSMVFIWIEQVPS